MSVTITAMENLNKWDTKFADSKETTTRQFSPGRLYFKHFGIHFRLIREKVLEERGV